MWWILPGFLHMLWLDHGLSQACAAAWDINEVLVIEVLGAAIGNLPGVIIGIIIGIVLVLIDRFAGIETNPFDIYDEGNGVYTQWWTMIGSSIPTPPLGYDLFDFRGQPI